ncbi:MAG: hypothetical protein AAGI88_10135 [Pseudomonadota bacterium]
MQEQYSDDDSVSRSLTLEDPLGPNLDDVQVTPTSFSFSDGMNILKFSYLKNFEFVLNLSDDEEITGLDLNHSGGTMGLGERAHHYLLAHLARLRAQHVSEGYRAMVQGWISNKQIARDMGTDMSHINIMIYRARRQLQEAIPHLMDGENLVERKRGRLRLGVECFSVYKSGECIARLPLKKSKSAKCS